MAKGDFSGKLVFKTFGEIERANLPKEIKSKLRDVLLKEIKEFGPEKAGAVVEWEGWSAYHERKKQEIFSKGFCNPGWFVSNFGH